MKRHCSTVDPRIRKALRVEERFNFLQLPTDLVLYCLKFAVSDEKDALAASRSCRFVKQIIYQTPCLFSGTVLVTPALAKVHPFWTSLECDDLSSTIDSLRLFRSTLDTLYISKEPIGCYASHLVEVGRFPGLRFLTIDSECNNVALASALHLGFHGLTFLFIPSVDICSYIASALPVNLKLLQARCISQDGAEKLRVLPKLTFLKLKLFCEDPFTLSRKFPSLMSYNISRFLNDALAPSNASTLSQSQLLDFTAFHCLNRLTVFDHARLKLPQSLKNLETYQSNLLIGEIPKLESLALEQNNSELPLLLVQLNQLCSMPSLESLSVEDIAPCTLQQLAALPKLWYLKLSNTSDPLHFYPITAMQFLEHLLIYNSRVSHFVVHHLLGALTGLTDLCLYNCPNVNVTELRACYPRVFIEEDN